MLVLVLLLSVAVPLLVLAAVLTLVLGRRRRARRAELARELATEAALRGPEPAVYRGTTGSYPQVLGNGLIALTAQRVLFRKLLGKGFDVPLTTVHEVRLQKAFNRGVVGGRVHLVLATSRGDVGFFVTDTENWAAAVTDAVRSATV